MCLSLCYSCSHVCISLESRIWLATVVAAYNYFDRMAHLFPLISYSSPECKQLDRIDSRDSNWTGQNVKHRGRPVQETIGQVLFVNRDQVRQPTTCLTTALETTALWNRVRALVRLSGVILYAVIH